MKPTLLILAAGMGSRYGGLKQIDQVGPSGEAIIDYSIYDAIRAGFGKIVFVIRRTIEEPFKAAIGNKFADKIEVKYVFQELDILPEGFLLPEERQKPWGTAHAVLVAKDVIKEPFAVINADDYYGVDAFKVLGNFLSNASNESMEQSMVGYFLRSTLSDHGSVNRGVCQTDEEGYLSNIVERINISKKENQAFYPEGDEEIEIDINSVVSMNMFGFTPAIFDVMEKDFIDFLKRKN